MAVAVGFWVVGVINMERLEIGRADLMFRILIEGIVLRRARRVAITGA